MENGIRGGGGEAGGIPSGDADDGRAKTIERRRRRKVKLSPWPATPPPHGSLKAKTGSAGGGPGRLTDGLADGLAWLTD